MGGRCIGCDKQKLVPVTVFFRLSELLPDPDHHVRMGTAQAVGKIFGVCFRIMGMDLAFSNLVPHLECHLPDTWKNAFTSLKHAAKANNACKEVRGLLMDQAMGVRPTLQEVPEEVNGRGDVEEVVQEVPKHVGQLARRRTRSVRHRRCKSAAALQVRAASALESQIEIAAELPAVVPSRTYASCSFKLHMNSNLKSCRKLFVMLSIVFPSAL